MKSLQIHSFLQHHHQSPNHQNRSRTPPAPPPGVINLSRPAHHHHAPASASPDLIHVNGPIVGNPVPCLPNKNLPLLSGRMLRFAKVIEKQMWDFEHPLRQHPLIKQDIVSKLENKNFTLEKLRELEGEEIGHLIHHVNAGHNINRAVEEIPLVEIDANTQPITRTVLT